MIAVPPAPPRVFAPDLMAGQVALVTGGGTLLDDAFERLPRRREDEPAEGW